MKINPRPPVDAGHGVTRRVLAESPEIMLVEFAFAEGGEGLPHSHPHVQSTFVKAGRYRFTVGDESFEVGPGDAFVDPLGRDPRLQAPRGAGRAPRHLHPPPGRFPLMLTVETRHAIDPATARSFDTDALREALPRRGHLRARRDPADLHPLRPDDRRRRRAGRRGADPRPRRRGGTASLLDRREMVVVNIGGDGTVEAAGATTPWSRATCSTSAWARGRSPSRAPAASTSCRPRRTPPTRRG